MVKVRIHIGPGGVVRAVHKEGFDFTALGCGPPVRGSNVLPGGRVKAAAFLLLRRLFGETGHVAAWTRRWQGPWQVDYSPLGDEYRYCLPRRFEAREQALAAEEEHLHENWVRRG